MEEVSGIKRDANGKFAVGNAGGPGRPKGQSMKEFWKQRFSEMTVEEKVEWIRSHNVTGDVIWRMAEGQPKQSLDGGEDKDGNPMPFTMVTLQNVHQGEIPTETLPAPTDTSV